MIRHLLLVAGGDSEPVEPLPPDPTLTELRQVTDLNGISQNYTTSPGRTYRTEHRICADTADLRLVYYGAGQAVLEEPWTGTVVVEAPDGSLHTVTWNGSPDLTVPLLDVIASDTVALPAGEGELIHLRTFIPNGVQFLCTGNGRTASYMEGNHTAGTWTPVDDPSGSPQTPLPIGILGHSRASTISPALLGDSIAGMGATGVGWWRLALNDHGLPGLGYGRPVHRFTNLDARMDETLIAATHLLVQYGVNDLSDSPTVPELWADALAAYAQADSLNPGIPTWQTTPTPIVGDAANDGCATLAGQTLVDYADERQAWCAFLRDGAPCHPATKAALPVGATGTVIRAGHADHPLRGIVDIAAAVEHGGSSSPTGKWRVDLGPLGGDGVHPSNLGMSIMVGPVSDWLATIT